jgi:anti-sigma-K factor RskA
MSEHEHARVTEDVPAYVLWVLEPGDTARVERHLEGCEECRADVDRLRASADALARSVEPVAPPPGARAELLRRVREEAVPGAAARPSARRLRWGGRARPLAWVAAGLVVGAGAGFAAARLDEPPGPRTVAAEVDRARLPDASASLLLPEEEGPLPVLRARGLELPARGRVYQLWLLRGSELVPSSVFTPRADGTAAVAITEPLEGVDAVLLTREPAGGARTPSEDPLLRAPV